MDGDLAPDQSKCDSGPEPEMSQECHVDYCEEEDLKEEEEEYEEELMEDFEPEELELQSSTRASPVIVSNEIPPIVPEKYTAADATASRREDAKFLPPSNSPCEDKFKNCNIVVQAHLCVYSFYQSNCCRSCRDITTKS